MKVGCECDFEIQRNIVFELLKNSLNTQNVEIWMGEGRNLVRSQIYSIVPKGHKENPDQANGDYCSEYC